MRYNAGPTKGINASAGAQLPFFDHFRTSMSLKTQNGASELNAIKSRDIICINLLELKYLMNSAHDSPPAVAATPSKPAPAIATTTESILESKIFIGHPCISSFETLGGGGCHNPK